MFAEGILHDVYRFTGSFLEREKYRKLAALRRAATHGVSLAGFDRTQSIFVHIPKTGGVSVSKALYGNRGGSHRSIAEYQMAFSARDFERYFKFCFVRNPWDRTYSAYRFLKKGGMDEEDRKWSERNLSMFADFEEFVTVWLNKRNAASWMHFWPQHSLLRSRFDGCVRVDFIGRFERLESDFAYVARQLGVDAVLPHENTSSSTCSYAEVYTQEMRAIVSEVYAEDARLFGYTFV